MPTEQETPSWDISFWGALLIAFIMGVQAFALLMSRKKIGNQRAEAMKLGEAFLQAKEKAKLEQNAAEREAAQKETARLAVELQEQEKKLLALEAERTAARERVAKVVSWEELFVKEER